MEEFNALIDKMDLSIHQLANMVTDIVIDGYGTHNYDAFKKIVNEKLK